MQLGRKKGRSLGFLYRYTYLIFLALILPYIQYSHQSAKLRNLPLPKKTIFVNREQP